MLTLNDGRSELWQWDTGRTLAVDADCSHVHFSNKVFGRSIDVDVVDGTAIIPDVLLQTDKDLNVWAFVGTAENGYTKISKTFTVNRRNKPADYVFTPTEQMTLQMIQRQIGDLADLTTEAKDTLVAAINEAARTGGGAGSMDLRVADGYVQYSTDGGMTWTNLIAMAELKGADGITPTIGSNGNWYLGDTDTGKPSRGETGPVGADGRDGADGQPGADGKSAYAYAVEGGYTGTETEFAAKLASEIPTALPNPEALTFTGAVTGSYDGSAPLEVAIPSGSGASGDYIPNPSTASVGQTIVVKATDENGKPTEWEAVDMAGGGEREWAFIEEITLKETAAKIEKTLDTPCDELLVVFSNLLSTPNSSIGVGISINGYSVGNTNNGMASGSFVHTSAPAHGIIQIVKAVDYWYGIVSGINSGANVNGNGITRPSGGNGKTKIESFNFWMTSPSINSICAGTTLKIYTR